MSETWKQVPIAPKYEVSTHGNVRNKKTGRVLSACKNIEGYMRLSLRVDDSSITTTVHRLVAMTFIPNPKNKYSVNHKNHVRDDNRLDNLEWATAREQSNHRRKTDKRETNIPSSRPIWKCNAETGERIEKFESIQLASKNVTTAQDGKSNISASARKNEKKGCVIHKAYGFLWEYEIIEIPGEIWKPLSQEHTKGVDGYHISNKGRLKNHRGRIASQYGKEGTYKVYKIHPYAFSAHRLVALTFLEKHPDKDTVNHIDGNKSNCCLSNLEWATPSENSQHAVDTGLNDCKKSIKQYTLKGEFVTEFPSINDARIATGFATLRPFAKVSLGSQWRIPEDTRPVTDISGDSRRRQAFPVKQYDMKGKFIREFESRKEACLWLGVQISLDVTTSSHGFQWRKEFDERPVLDLSHKTKRQRRS